MAAADYHSCDNCGAKTFYDADIDGFYDRKSDAWIYGVEGISGYRAYALCHKCTETHEIIVRRIAHQPDSALADELRDALVMAVAEMMRASGRLETIATCNEDRRIAAALSATCDYARTALGGHHEPSGEAE